MENNQIIKYDNEQLTKVGNAIAVTNKLLVLSAEVYFESGTKKAQLGKYNEAISDYSKAVELKPNFDLAIERKYTLMGMLYCNEGNYEEAKICFKKVIELSDDTYAFEQLLLLLVGTQEFDSALNYLEIAIQKFPENSKFYLIRGELRRTHLEKYEDAIDDLTKAIAIERKTEDVTEIMQDAYLERALSRAEIGDDEGSKRDYTIINLNNTALRIRKEGFTEEEKNELKMRGLYYNLL